MTTPPKTKVRLRLWLAGASLLLAMAGGAVLPAVASASATIYYVGKSSAQTGSGASSMVLSTPANAAVGDVMIMGIDADTTTSFSAPSGWSTSGLYAGGLYWNCCWFSGYSVEAYKIVTAGDIGASYTVNLAATRRAVGVILDYTGTSSSPIETSSTNWYNGTTLAYSSITTPTNGSMILFGGSVTDGSSTPTMTAPAIATRRVSSYATTGTTPILVGDWSDWLQSTAGATGAQNGTVSASDVSGEITIGLAPASSGSLQFATAPAMSTLPTLTLNGQAQTLQTKLNNFSVDDTTGTGSGWNVTVQGNSQFAEYCPNATCGTDSGPGYVASGATLPADSLTLNSTSASFTAGGGTTGTAPTLQCNSTCNVDSATPVKVASAALSAGMGTWNAGSWTGTCLALSTPSTL